jgi:hypothetical protein
MLDFLEKDILMLNFMESAVHQPCAESTSDFSRLQSLGDLMPRYIWYHQQKEDT